MPIPFLQPPSPRPQRHLALLLVVAAHFCLILAASQVDSPPVQSPEVVMEATLLIAAAPASPTFSKPANTPLAQASPLRPTQPAATMAPTTLATTTSPTAASENQAASTAVVSASAPASSSAPTYSAAIFDAAYLKNPAPPYPVQARRLGEEGRVVLRVQVSPQGLAEQLEIQSSSGSPRLDGAAIATVRQWKFVAARRGDQPVSSWVAVPVIFRLE